MKINKLIDKCIEDDVDIVKVHIDVLYEYAKEYNELTQKIDKAIEYIKEHQEKQFAFNFEYALRDNEIDILLEILGDKENE